MSIKVTCDACGKEINVMEDCHKFDSFDVCQDCRGKLEKFADDWRFEKRIFFMNFLDVRLRRLEKPSKSSKPSKPPKPPKTELPYVSTKDIRPNARLHMSEIIKCGKSHVHVVKGQKPTADSRYKLVVTTRELADELHCKIHTLQCYANRHDLGVMHEKKRTKVFNFLEAEAIRAHFKGQK